MLLENHSIEQDNYGFCVYNCISKECVDLGDGVSLNEEEVESLFPGENWRQHIVKL